MKLIRKVFERIFICECKKDYGLASIKVLQHCNISENKIVVGRCLNCNKRKYGRIIYFKKFSKTIGKEKDE